ncbi:MAG: hypothetical protein WCO72_06820, partial [Betaproteobacteria bacterium]
EHEFIFSNKKNIISGKRALLGNALCVKNLSPFESRLTNMKLIRAMNGAHLKKFKFSKGLKLCLP